MSLRTSVAMAVRNGDPYLDQLLGSLVAQRTPPFELVVCDDASVDGTSERLRAFQREAPFPVAVCRREARAGYVDSFLDAASRCTGDLIAFCDQDDVWAERKLATCADLVKKTDASLVLHPVRVVDQELRDLGSIWPKITRTQLVPALGTNHLEAEAPGMTMVFQRKLIELIDWRQRPTSRFQPGRPMLHDEWILFLANVIGPIQLVAEPLVLYRQHPENASGGWKQRRRRLSMHPALDDYAKAAELTAGYSSFLASAASALGDSPLAPRFREAAESYAARSENWNRRRRLYDSASRRRRARLVTQMAAAHAYGPRRLGGMGRAALVKDLTAGVALSR